MTELMQGLLAEAKNGRFSSIRDTISEDDISSVWENAAAFIDKQMSQQKGVNIPNLGVFTFSQKKLDIGNNKFVLIQRPVFNISEKFAQTHGLHFTKYYVPGQIPVVPLNYSSLSYESPFDRDTVESCIRETLNAVNRALSNKKNVEILFNGIGRLSIRESRVKMKFFKEFINHCDGSGKLIDSLQNRPGTLDSVMSDRSLQSRATTSNTLVLPKITSSQQINNLAPLPEQVEEFNDPALEYNPLSSDIPVRDEDDMAITPTDDPIPDPVTDTDVILGMPDPVQGDFNTDHAITNILNTGEIEPTNDTYTGEDVQPLPNVLEEENRLLGPMSVRSGSRQTMALPKATGVSSFEDLLPSTLSPTYNQIPPTPLVAKSCPGPAFLGETDGFFPPRTPLNKILSPPHLEPLHRVRSAELVGEMREVAFAENTKPMSACGHSNAGQEICYLCHQRSSRNIPVSFDTERKRREEEENSLLREYQALKDGEDMLREQEKLMSKRNDLQKIAAFNLGVADAVITAKKHRDTDFHRSYVFQKRPLTPSRFPKQDAYNRELQKQVELKEKNRSSQKADTDFLERLEQVQLAEDLAAQREQYLKNKYQQQDSYKKSLETQLQFKPQPLQGSHEDGEVFGLNDINNEKMAERRRRAYDLFREQQDLVAQKKRDAILRRLAEQEEEEEVLKKTKQELTEDRGHRHSRRFTIRRELEGDWFKAAQSKRAHELQDRLSNLNPGMLVHEQCDKYKRCKKCQRKITNHGESNIWGESRYIPGSRLMV
ncbi:hypothetical protein LOTGIDRAFT_229612 [Lottia gigantea]|uniref:CCDC81 HU domain-containing protein n=1 Tax=Lottia gigantea TaxID=225164 RepID=V3Z0T0_LOTGI|nr:hypothetical protein LOTGIDRAFT_229612 [Lottia gigantea]ESO84113.1 hypothetical protein LOTGIDRAFT_229612 [Lottia gigantea]